LFVGFSLYAVRLPYIRGVGDLIPFRLLVKHVYY